MLKRGTCSAHLIGNIVPGVKRGVARVVVKNRSLCAYMSSNAVFVYQIPNMLPHAVINNDMHRVTSIALAPGKSQLIAISYLKCETRIINTATNETLISFTTKSFIAGMEWGANKDVLYLFTTFFEVYYVYHISDARLEEVKMENLMNFRYIHRRPKCPGVLLGGNNNGRLTLLDANEKEQWIHERPSKVRSVDVDPRAISRCLCVWEGGSWGYFDMDGPLQVIGEANNLQYRFGAGCIIERPANHFITGDANVGIVRVWNPASERPVESYQVYGAGFVSMTRISVKKVACSFEDGTFGILSLTKKELVFRNVAGHSSLIIGCGFTATKHVFVTGASEGSICIWNRENLKLIDRIHHQFENRHMTSVDVSAGGGYVAAGYSNGKISIFSVTTRQKVFTVALHKEPVDFVLFNTEHPNIIMTASAKDQTLVLYDIEAKKLLLNLAFTQKPISAIFCPGNTFVVSAIDGNIYFVGSDCQVRGMAWYVPEGEFVAAMCACPYSEDILLMATEQGKIMVIERSSNNKIAALRALNMMITCVQWSPFMTNLIAIGTKSGQILLADLKEKKFLMRIQAHHGPVKSIRFSESHPFEIITVSRDMTIKKWLFDKIFYQLEIENLLGPSDRHPMSYYRPSPGSGNLNRLVNYIANPNDPPMFEMDDIYHYNTTMQIATEKIDVVLRKHSSASIMKRAMHQKQSVKEAARIALQTGDVRRYCELMCSINEFDKAIVAAPAVSYEFWVEMQQAKAKATDDESDKLAIQILTGKRSEAIDTLCEKNDDAAMALAVAESNGLFDRETRFTIIPPKRRTFEVMAKNTNSKAFLDEYEFISKVVRYHRKQGNPLVVACAFLSIGDIENALITLMKSSELFYAMEMDMMLNINMKSLRERFAKVCIAHNVAIDRVFNLLEDDSKMRLAPLVQLETQEERQAFFESIGILPLPEPTTLKQSLHNLICEGKENSAIDLFLEKARETLIQPFWDFPEMKDLIEEMEMCNLKRASKKKRIEVLAIAYYLAAYDGAWKGYRPAMEFLVPLVVKIVNGNELQWMKPLLKTLELLSEFSSHNSCVRVICQGCRELNVITDQASLKTKRGPILSIGEKGEGLTILHAEMWFDMTPFSPLEDGEIYYVF